MTTAETILSCTKADAGKLFPGGEKEIKSKFRKLAAAWHPDRNADPEAAMVFQKVMELRDIALNGGKKSSLAQMTTFTTDKGKTFKARIITSTSTDYGKVHIGPRSLSYEYDPGLLDIAQIERRRVEEFRFADAEMKAQMSHSLPTLVASADLQGQGGFNIYERPASEVLLSDFVNHFGPMPDVHAAWLGSGLLNIACYLQWSGLVHGAIGMDTVLIDPETHSVRLAGGWGFSVSAGERPQLLPNRTLDVVPAMAIPGQVATHALDLELIRRTIREALGDPSGSRLKSMGIPDAVGTFLIMAPGKTAFEDYALWQEALKKAWGKRRFITFNGSSSDVYGG